MASNNPLNLPSPEAEEILRSNLHGLLRTVTRSKFHHILAATNLQSQAFLAGLMVMKELPAFNDAAIARVGIEVLSAYVDKKDKQAFDRLAEVTISADRIAQDKVIKELGLEKKG